MVNTLNDARTSDHEGMTLLESVQVGEDIKKAYYVKSFVVRDDETKAPTRQITGHKDLLSSSELDESVMNAIKIRQMQQAEFVTARPSQVFETSRCPSRK